MVLFVSGATVVQQVRTGVARASRPRAARWAWAGVLIAAGLVLFGCYLRLSNTQAVTSDGAASVLHAWDAVHGNWLLRGWTIPDVSFYTTEMPEYMLVEAVRGMNPGVVHVAAALTYTLLVLLAGMLARGRATGREGVIRFLIAAGIMLAPQPGAGTFVLLLQPDHLGTQVPLFVAWLILDRAPRRWYVPVVIAAILTWTAIGDRVAWVTGVVPLAAVCLLVAGREGTRRSGQRAWRWFELSLAGAAVASLALSALASRLITAIGGFKMMWVAPNLASPHMLPKNVAITGEDVFSLYGAHLSGGQSTAGIAFAVIHLAGVALAVCALAIAFQRFFRADLVVQVLAAAIVINLAFYAASTLTGTGYAAREIDAVLPMGAVLAGRLLAGLAGRRLMMPVLGAVLACYVAALGYGAAQPAVPALNTDLAGWLVEHHMGTGLATDESNIVTVETGGRVNLLVTSFKPPGPAPRAYQSDASWYHPWLHDANFVVLTPPGMRDPISPGEVLRAFGPPVRVYHYHGYTIMVWNKNLLAHLGKPRWN
jgi:hypothetical protein